MIPLAMVHRIAKEKGVPETSVIRDYAQNHLLAALFQHEPIMVLKGGTCLRKIYFPDYRFSDDLDFTLTSDIPDADVSKVITGSLLFARKVSGILFEERFEMEATATGLDCETFFVYGPLNLRMKIKLDITRAKDESILLSIQRKPLYHPYPDSLEAVISVYSIEEMLAEKIRSLFQRTRPRDLYDVWYMQGKTVPMTHILDKKFSQKGLKLHIPHLLEKKVNFEKAWNNSLKHQMSSVPDFDAVFEKVLKELQKYQAKDR